MSVITKGRTFSNGEQLTAEKLNVLVDDASFDSSTAVDNSTTRVNSSGAITVKPQGITSTELASSAVTTAKIADATGTSDGVTLDKIRQLESMKTIGNVTGSTAAPTQVDILDEDDMSSDSATSLATQQSIKAYVDTFSLNGYVHVRDEKSSGSGGGTFTSGAWQTRTLNTAASNTISGASLSSNQLTLPAGTYEISATAPYNKGNGTSVTLHKMRLYDTTGASTLIEGSSHESPLDAMTQHAHLVGRFTLSTSSAIELQHYCSFTGTFGEATSIGTKEVYAEMEVRKVGI
jgi:hypothetical protein